MFLIIVESLFRVPDLPLFLFLSISLISFDYEDINLHDCYLNNKLIEFLFCLINYRQSNILGPYCYKFPFFYVFYIEFCLKSIGLYHLEYRKLFVSFFWFELIYLLYFLWNIYWNVLMLFYLLSYLDLESIESYWFLMRLVRESFSWLWKF